MSQSEGTYRDRVLVVIEASSDLLTAQQIAQATCLTYRQTIDALNALNNMAKVQRVGRKFTAKWGRVTPSLDENPALLLQSVFRGFFK